MRNHKHGVFFTLLSFPLLVAQFYWFGGALCALGLILLYKWQRHPLRILKSLIAKDAKASGAPWPLDNHGVEMELVAYYSRYQRLLVQYPLLAQSYREYTRDMWTRLAQRGELNQWKEVLAQAYRDLPVPEKKLASESLDRLKRDIGHFQKAKEWAS